MILWLAIGLVGAIIGGLVNYFDWDSRDPVDFFVGMIPGAFFGAIVGLFVVLGLSFTGSYDITEERRYDLVAAKDGAETEGGFFLFAGYIDESLVYRFYYRQGDGGIKGGELDADYAVIYEDGGNEYVIKAKGKSARWYRFGGAPNLNGYYARHEFHVPEGSVDRQVEFDLD